MKKAKDNFSKQSTIYKQFRPTYPDELFQFILRFCSENLNCWDCGTGNGQVAKELVKHFDSVYATDISNNQLKNAIRKPNIFYSESRAEKTSFPDNFFNLITVGQAIHWFDFKKFFEEVYRVSQANAIIAVFGYGLLKIERQIDQKIQDFYSIKIGKYWDIERKHIDEEYKTIPFPFKEFQVNQNFKIQRKWSLLDLEGYLNTWSAVQKYIAKNNHNPVLELIDSIKDQNGENYMLNINFPVFIRIGIIDS